MQQAPHEPCNESRDGTIAILGDSDAPNNGRQFAGDEWLGRAGRLLTRYARRDEPANIAALLLRYRCEARKRTAVGAGHVRRVADHETFGMRRNGEVSVDSHGS